MKPVIWKIKDIVNILKARQDNEFDGNIAVSGERGNGKSCLLTKIFYRYSMFDPWKHQVYSRPDVIKLLKTQQRGLCFDDEAINSSYKRDFQKKGQQEFIKILTAYRDNYNIFASAIPSFFSLDKDLRDLYFLHLHIIERGMAVVHMPLQGRLYSQDRWDAKYNARIEDGWSKKMKDNSDFRPAYNKLSTFKGYIYWNDMTIQQKTLYKLVKKTKRENSFQTQEEQKANIEISFLDKVYNRLIEKGLSQDGLLQLCLVEGRKYSTINSTLNNMLKDNGIQGTVKDYLIKDWRKAVHNSSTHQIKSLIPDIPL